MTKVAAEAHVIMEYPKVNELILGKQYTFRLVASNDVKDVEVSVNGGHWQQCRPIDGFFWYDWNGFDQGDHKIIARARLHDGSMEKTDIRRVQVA